MRWGSATRPAAEPQRRARLAHTVARRVPAGPGARPWLRALDPERREARDAAHPQRLAAREAERARRRPPGCRSRPGSWSQTSRSWLPSPSTSSQRSSVPPRTHTARRRTRGVPRRRVLRLERRALGVSREEAPGGRRHRADAEALGADVRLVATVDHHAGVRSAAPEVSPPALALAVEVAAGIEQQVAAAAAQPDRERVRVRGGT